MNIGFERRGIYLGSMSFPFCKKHKLVIRRGNKVIVLGTFRNDESLVELEKALDEMFGEVTNNE